MVRAFFNEKAAIWDEEIAEKDSSKLERMLQRLDIKPGFTVLDVGTGTGIFVPFLLNKIGVRGQLIAIDIAEEMLKISRAKGFYRNVEHLHADIVNLPLAEKIFDAIVCYSSFPHFYNKPWALTEMSRVLKNEGRLFICHTSSRSAINEIHLAVPAVQNDIIPDTEEMLGLLSAAGFSDIKIEDNNDSYLTRALKPQNRTAG
jgi:ubiquinone/menaquinone biosynthesis C-methylase UbiE